MRCKFEVLSQDEIYDIHVASLEVLEYTGATFRTQEALRIFDDYGAIVDHDRLNVKIPAYMVDELVRKAPKKYILYGRNPERNVECGGKNQILDLAGDCSYVIDLETGKRRPGLLEDSENFIRLSDALENTPQPYPVVRYPHDVPEDLQHVELSMIHYKNTSAPMLILCEDKEIARDCIELAATAAGGEEELRKKPNAYNGGMCPSSPLLFDDKLTAGVMECAKRGLPVWFMPMDNAGASAPITIAGTIVQTNATNLAAICLMQIINPGVGVSYGSIPCFMDFRTGIASVACPEESLHCAAIAQMAKFYGLPSMSWSGISDSKTFDVQAGYESALGLLPTLLAGANRVVCGALESYYSACYESVVIENEIFGMAKRMADGIKVDEDTMAVSLINKVAPLAATKMGGHYMAEKHTLAHATRERYIPKLSDKTTRDTWQKNGSKTLTQVAKERVREILAKHKPEPPPPDVLREMEKKAEEIRKRVLSRRK
jgi:trimethylamine--corrinoid protein Co-methyltransferase